MASSSYFSPFSGVLLLLLSCLLSLGQSGGAGTFVLDVHHRFSDEVRRWAESTSWETSDFWPEKGSLPYYASLVEHDRALLHRRGLAGVGGAGNRTSVLTFKDGNSTFRLSRLGSLHYSFVSVGTPPQRFLVALDTGSNLFWVPCDCIMCATNVSSGISFNMYNSSLSTTSKRVPCNSSLCTRQATCSKPSDACPYTAQYLYPPDLSTSGILLQDVLHLTTEGGITQEAVQATVTLGCGRIQTGDFLRDIAPNGILGLGMSRLSVPSALATAGHISQSFSMCFSPDGRGRIRFGDNGSVDQQETPLVPNSLQAYAANVTGIQINGTVLEEKFTAVVDSLVSFTSLTDPMYTNISEAFDSLVRDARHPPISGFPFQYCYNISSNGTSVIPNIALLMEGGSRFPVIRPLIVVVKDNKVAFYCLAILKSTSINIIGQSFLTELRIVFDGKKSVLGWKVANCYDDVPTASPATSSPPGPTVTSPSTPPQSPIAGGPPELSNGSFPGNSGGVRPSSTFTLVLCLIS